MGVVQNRVDLISVAVLRGKDDFIQETGRSGGSVDGLWHDTEVPLLSAADSDGDAHAQRMINTTVNQQICINSSC